MIPQPKMSLKYFAGWWAALCIISRPGMASAEEYSVTGTVVAYLLLTALSYGLARLGWRLGWFRKTP